MHFSGSTFYGPLQGNGVQHNYYGAPRTPADDPPPPEPMTVPEWVVDRDERRRVVDAVCGSSSAVGISTSLTGAGGFGKTVLARLVCADPQVRERFNGRIYTITLGRDLAGSKTIAAKVAEVTRFITADTEIFDDPDMAGDHLGRLLDSRPPTLLVLDDVWSLEQLAPFLRGGRPCVRLFTTRIPDLHQLLPNGLSVEVVSLDEMSSGQARAVLTHELSPLPVSVVDGLLAVTGRWALLLRMTNRLIAEQVATGADPATAASQALHDLRAAGPTAVDDPTEELDLDNPGQRNRAVRATVAAAIDLLPADAPERFAELAVFAQGEAIPVPVITEFWKVTGSLTERGSRSLCRRLQRLSLLSLTADDGGRVILHDVIREYLLKEFDDGTLEVLHGRLVDSLAARLPHTSPLAAALPEPSRAWWQMQESYLLDHLIEHLLAAGRTAQAEAVASDVRWVEARLMQRGPTAPWSDLERVPTAWASARARTIAQAAHLLTACDPPHALLHVLHNRFDALPQWRDQIIARRQHEDAGSRPVLGHAWPPPDLPNPLLLRTLTGHAQMVTSVAISPDGTWLASTDGHTVRIWDQASGTCGTILTTGNDGTRDLAISPDGTWLATASRSTVRCWDRVSGTWTTILTTDAEDVHSVAICPDGTWLAIAGGRSVRIWERARAAWTTTLTVDSHGPWELAISPDGAWLATASHGLSHGLRIWDRSSGTCIPLSGQTSFLMSVAISPDGTWVAGADGRSVRIWERDGGTWTATMAMGSYDDIYALAISPDGTWLASGGRYGTVQIWDAASGACTANLRGHTADVLSLAISPDGAWLATVSKDTTVRVWDTKCQTPLPDANNRAQELYSVAIAPDGSWIATAGSRGIVQIWDRASGTCTETLTPDTRFYTSVAIAPDATWLAITYDDDQGRVLIWDRTSNSFTGDFHHPGRVLSVAISPDGAWLATGDDDATVRIWDRASRTHATLTAIEDSSPPVILTDWMAGPPLCFEPGSDIVLPRRASSAGSVPAVAISPDGTWLATSHSRNGVVRIWDVASRSCTATLTGDASWVPVIAISPDGTWLATVENDLVRIWDVASRTCTTTLAGHAGTVRAVAISPDGVWLATGSDDTTVRIWDLRSQRTVTLARTEGPLKACTWAADSRTLTVAGDRGLYLMTLYT
ncbi:NB-ARC domain-containing protein [Streptomyces sp. NPDC053086]|uniref:NB-ARC domain-containing protein n=1 Tax=unclassified Streptomyces TaxID=2593676 RepID=UPI0037D96E55